MSTATMTREPRRGAAMFSTDNITRELAPKKSFKKGEGGASILVLDDVAVFRSGTFRDSMGLQNTWEDIHLDQMVSYFEMLRSRNIFADVPVRSGHPGWLVSGQEGSGKVIGYHSGLRAEKRTSSHDGNEYYYLIATYEILDADAQTAINSGLWRNRSAEVGTYITNNDAEFWPVYQGVAYVDIPAVEGLNGFSKQSNFSSMIEEESMTVENAVTTPPVPPVAPVAPVPAVAFSAPVATETAPVAQFAAPTQVQSFSVAGQPTSDFAAVQSHINMLELFQSETVKAGRLDFVTSLVTGNQIMATQLDAMSAFAQTLSDAQFTAWHDSMAVSAPQPILGVYGDALPTGDQPNGTIDLKADRIEVLKGTLKQHSRANMPVDKIKATRSYVELVSLDPTFVL